jgi:hypothetical protein
LNDAEVPAKTARNRFATIPKMMVWDLNECFEHYVLRPRPRAVHAFKTGIQVRSSVLSPRSIPTVPLILGLSGLIPFWVLAFGLGAPGLRPWDSAALDFALVTYAAVILSFLGGIRWGMAVAKSERPDAAMHYVISVVPSLVAWALLILREPLRLGCLGGLALLLGPIDQRLVPAGYAPPWFGRLRLILSCGAGLALIYAALLWRGE